MTTSIRTSADGLSSIIAVNGVDKFSVDQNGKATATKFAGDGSELTGILKSGTAINTTSGTAHDFTGIPAGVKRITLMLSGVSTNATSGLLLQIGDSGGVENSGYVALSGLVSTSGGHAYPGITSGYSISYGIGAAADTFNGAMILTNLSGNIWVLSGNLMQSYLNYLITCAGSKTLSGTLDRIRLTTVNGTDLFDAGKINILYE